LVGYLDHRFHRGHIVDADHVRSAEDGRSDGCRGGAFEYFFGSLFRLRQERFARRRHQDRKLERAEFAQPRENLGVLLLAFPEAEPGIDRNARPVHSRADSAVHRGVQIVPDRAHDIF